MEKSEDKVEESLFPFTTCSWCGRNLFTTAILKIPALAFMQTIRCPYCAGMLRLARAPLLIAYSGVALIVGSFYMLNYTNMT